MRVADLILHRVSEVLSFVLGPGTILPQTPKPIGQMNLEGNQ